MLPEIGASELLVIAIVALIVVGPKDLPALLRKLGQFVAKLRGMAEEFRSSFDEMARQSELDDLRKEVAAMRSGQFAATSALAAPLADYADINRELTDATTGIAASPPTTFAYAEPGAVMEEPAPAKPARKPRAAAKPKAANATAAKTPTKPRARKKTPETGA